VDWRDSARLTNIFLASGFFCSQTFSQPARQPLTQAVGRQNQSAMYGYSSIEIGKQHMKNIQPLLLMLALLSVMTACQPALKEFQPAKDSLFKITFSYPASWNWVEDIPFDEPPPFAELPPSERIILENGSLENGSISIQVYESSKPHTEIKEWIKTYSRDSAFTLRANTTLQIDGYDARWLTLSTVAYSSQNNRDVQQEVIYLFTDDRYYTIDLTILESEIDGRVHKEFEEVIKTIKVLP
jgi:hypothetical protein